MYYLKVSTDMVHLYLHVEIIQLIVVCEYMVYYYMNVKYVPSLVLSKQCTCSYLHLDQVQIYTKNMILFDSYKCTYGAISSTCTWFVVTSTLGTAYQWMILSNVPYIRP